MTTMTETPRGGRPVSSGSVGAQMSFRASREQRTWFDEPVTVTITVGPNLVDVESGGVHGVVARDELREWFQHGKSDLDAYTVKWMPRPLGVAVSFGVDTVRLPYDVAVKLMRNL